MDGMANSPTLSYGDVTIYLITRFSGEPLGIGTNTMEYMASLEQ